MRRQPTERLTQALPAAAGRGSSRFAHSCTAKIARARLACCINQKRKGPTVEAKMVTRRRANIRRDDTKLNEAIVYLSTLTERDRFCGAVKLNKLLFYADFIAYRRFGESITGQEYQHLPQGPCPRGMKPALENLEKHGDIATREEPLFGGNYRQKRTFARRLADLSQFSGPEVDLFREVVERFWDTNATDISDLSHEFIGWKLTEINETIPYSTALIGTRKPSEHETKVGQHLRKLAKEALARTSR
jgi:hypothetical protein